MDILYKDQDIVVVIKPRGVLSEEKADDACMPTLLAPQVGKVYTVHRLDRAVGGVMVYARHSRAAARLTAAMQAGELKKIYTAVVAGALLPGEGEWRDMLYHDARQNKTFVVSGERKGAKEAILRYRVTDKAAVNGVECSRVTVELLTGRSHQIRVQFASRRHALIGDGKYGSRVKAPYPSLYATELSFPHPKNGRKMSFSAPVPGDFPWNIFTSAHYEIERKFLIAYPDAAMLSSLAGCRVKRIRQTYLQAPEGETRRVREVREGERVRYVYTLKKRVSMIRAVEEEKELSAADYEQLLTEADAGLHPVCKTRYAIPYGDRVLEVDLYDFWQDRATLEVELESENEPLTLPSYIKVIREVTEDARYKNVNLARNLPTEPLE